MNTFKSYFFEDISLGQNASISKVIREEDVQIFAQISGDKNPLHLDDNYASETIFGGRIAHGFLCGSLISTVFGTKMPGPGSIYVSQDMRFLAPVRIDDEVTAEVTVVDTNPAKKILFFKTECLVKGKVVVQGHAAIMVPSRESQKIDPETKKLPRAS